MDRQNISVCNELRPCLVDHLHGRSDRLREKIDRHLTECSECREWIEFIRTVEKEYVITRLGARLGFEKRLERVIEEARARVVPGRFQRRFLAGLVGVAAAAIALIGGLLPTVHDSIAWLGSLGISRYVIAGLCASATIILSSPILIDRARNRMEGS